MRLLDAQYTATPLYGSRRMTAWLRSQGSAVNRKRVTRLMREMGIEAVDTQPKRSQPTAGHERYPSLLRGVQIERVNHVWSTDITSIRLQHGLIDLVAVIDWCSRYVLSWALSMPLDSAFCLEALESALQGGRPEIFNTDQGAPCTSRACTERLRQGGVQISMDGRGRALDNVFVERLWRTVKYEEVSLREYSTVREDSKGWDAPVDFTTTSGSIRHGGIARLRPSTVAWGSAVHKTTGKEVRHVQQGSPMKAITCQ